MDGQLAITLAAISLAGVYIVWSAYSAWQNSRAGGCGRGCGCAKATAAGTQKSALLIPAEQLTMRLKR